MMTVDQMIEVLTAYKAGKKIESRYKFKPGDDTNWYAFGGCDFDFRGYDYRVKPEPKVIWVNEYESIYAAHGSKQVAKVCGPRALRVAVRYVECPEGDAS